MGFAALGTFGGGGTISGFPGMGRGIGVPRPRIVKDGKKARRKPVRSWIMGKKKVLGAWIDPETGKRIGVERPEPTAEEKLAEDVKRARALGEVGLELGAPARETAATRRQEDLLERERVRASAEERVRLAAEGREAGALVKADVTARERDVEAGEEADLQRNIDILMEEYTETTDPQQKDAMAAQLARYGVRVPYTEAPTEPKRAPGLAGYTEGEFGAEVERRKAVAALGPPKATRAELADEKRIRGAEKDREVWNPGIPYAAVSGFLRLRPLERKAAIARHRARGRDDYADYLAAMEK